MMATVQKCLLLAVGLAQVAWAQQSAGPSPRIICTPPTLKVVKMVRPKIPPDAKNIFGLVSVQAEIDKTFQRENPKRPSNTGRSRPRCGQTVAVEALKAQRGGC